MRVRPRHVENVQVRVLHKISRQPTDGKRFKFSILVGSGFQAGCQLGFPFIGENPDHGDKRVGKFRMVPFVFISERNNEITILRVFSIAQASRYPGFDSVYDLFVKRFLVVRKIDIPRLQRSSLCDSDGTEKKGEGLQAHVSELQKAEFNWKPLVAALTVVGRGHASGVASTSTDRARRNVGDRVHEARMLDEEAEFKKPKDSLEISPLGQK